MNMIPRAAHGQAIHQKKNYMSIVGLRVRVSGWFLFVLYTAVCIDNFLQKRSKACLTFFARGSCVCLCVSRLRVLCPQIHSWKESSNSPHSFSSGSKGDEPRSYIACVSEVRGKPPLFSIFFSWLLFFPSYS